MVVVCPIPFFDMIIKTKALNVSKKEYVDVYYLLSDFLLAFMFFRVILLYRAIINFSVFLDMYSKKVCAAIGFSANTRFAFKCFIKAKPGLTVLIIFTSSVLILAYDLRIFQIPYGVAQNLVEWNGLWDSIWCIIITMTTVGYGDVVPSTAPGRIIAIFTAMWGAFLISLMVLSVGQIFALNEKEEEANEHLKKARVAARAISTFLKMLVVKRRFRVFRQ